VDKGRVQSRLNSGAGGGTRTHGLRFTKTRHLRLIRLGRSFSRIASGFIVRCSVAQSRSVLWLCCHNCCQARLLQHPIVGMSYSSATGFCQMVSCTSFCTTTASCQRCMRCSAADWGSSWWLHPIYQTPYEPSLPLPPLRICMRAPRPINVHQYDVTWYHTSPT
jgi:hypothetical protein